MRYDIIVDGQGLNDLLFITNVIREAGPPKQNREIQVEALILKDTMQTLRTFNKMVTGELQRLEFTDEPDVYWLGKLKEGIKPNKSEAPTTIKFSFIVPDGVAYAVTPIERHFDSAPKSIVLQNNGSNPVYPLFEFNIKEPTYMLSVLAKDKVFQFGESYDSAPLKQIKISHTETEAGHYEARQYYMYYDKFSKISLQWFDPHNINPDWNNAGNLVRRGGVKEKTPTNGRITIARSATHWQTGERMANFVKGQTYDVAQTKSVNQSKSTKAYLLKRGWVYVGWLLSQDIDGPDGGNAANADDLITDAGANSGGWHGSARSFDIAPNSTDFVSDTWLNFYKMDARQYGAMFFSVLAQDGSELARIQFSAHQPNMSTWIQFFVGGQGVDVGSYDYDIASYFWGKWGLSKAGGTFSFEVYNDIKKKTINRTYNFPDLANKEPGKAVIGILRYGNAPKVQEMSFASGAFKKMKAWCWVEPKDKTVTEYRNIPDPRYTFNAGDTIQLNMTEGKAYLNGAPCLTPIALGSDPLDIVPGSQEVAVISNSVDNTPPELWVRYREEYR